VSYNETAKCAIDSCSSPNGIKYHSFPKNSYSIQQIWMKACNRDFHSIKNAKICSRHFTPESYERDLRNELLGIPVRKKLKHDAVPTLHLEPEMVEKQAEVNSRKGESFKKEILNVSSIDNEPLLFLADVKVLKKGRDSSDLLQSESHMHDYISDKKTQCSSIDTEKLDRLKRDLNALEKELRREQAKTNALKRKVRRIELPHHQNRIIRSYLRKKFNASQTKFLMNVGRKEKDSRLKRVHEKTDHNYTMPLS